MYVSLDKALALTIYAVARQAERSLDFGMQSQAMWDGLRDYYNQERMERFGDAVAALRAKMPEQVECVTREQVDFVGGLWIVAYPFRSAMNRFRTTWRFSKIEVQFMLQSLDAFLDMLKHADKPDSHELVQVRMQLCSIQRVIERRLVGLPALRSASNIEHFGQSAYRSFIEFDEIVPAKAVVR